MDILTDRSSFWISPNPIMSLVDITSSSLTGMRPGLQGPTLASEAWHLASQQPPKPRTKRKSGDEAAAAAGGT